ncbi:MAG: UDP-N-acetylmuramoyl-tripeptide--D-alanyl-D-alanine ligase [Candidatus Nanopelagicaceae bacterium]
MIPMKSGEIARIMEGKIFGDSENVISGNFEFDSRQIHNGDVFIALLGESKDGHDYAPDAFERGAKLAITSKPVHGDHILVSDVLLAISKLANHLRLSLKDLKVIGITGSQGKTTTKDLLKSILSLSGETIAPPGSYNNEIGVPITLLKANTKTSYCILEMGARHQGDIARLTEIAQPNVGIVLKVGLAHLGEFGSRENIARTKGELIRGLKNGETAILGTYDEFTPNIASGLDLRVLYFGEKPECDVRAADIEIKGGYASFDLVTKQGRERVELQILGAHQIANALAAAAAAISLGLDLRLISEGLSQHTAQSKWRMELHKNHEITLINDSYNSNPESCKAAIQTLRQLSQESGGQSWAFLGKMHELGSESDVLHKEVGEYALSANIDNLIAIGESSFISNLSNSNTMTASVLDWRAATEFIARIEPGDVVLIKGSRAENLDQLANATLEFIEKRHYGSSGEGGERI